MEDCPGDIYSASRSRSGSYLGPQSGYDHETPTQGLHAIVAQLTANIETPGDAKNSLEMELASTREATESFTSRLDAVEHTLDRKSVV